MAQIEVEVLDKLPHSAQEIGSKDYVKYKEAMRLLTLNKDSRTFFIKLKGVDRKSRSYLKKTLASKFGETMWDMLKDDFVDTTIYIRKNPYYVPPKEERNEL